MVNPTCAIPDGACSVHPGVGRTVFGTYSAWLSKVKGDSARAKWLSNTCRRYFTIDFRNQILSYRHSESQTETSTSIPFKDILGATVGFKEPAQPMQGLRRSLSVTSMMSRGSANTANEFPLELLTSHRKILLWANRESEAREWVALLNGASRMGKGLATKQHFGADPSRSLDSDQDNKTRPSSAWVFEKSPSEVSTIEGGSDSGAVASPTTSSCTGELLKAEGPECTESLRHDDLKPYGCSSGATAIDCFNITLGAAAATAAAAAASASTASSGEVQEPLDGGDSEAAAESVAQAGSVGVHAGRQHQSQFPLPLPLRPLQASDFGFDDEDIAESSDEDEPDASAEASPKCRASHAAMIAATPAAAVGVAPAAAVADSSWCKAAGHSSHAGSAVAAAAGSCAGSRACESSSEDGSDEETAVVGRASRVKADLHLISRPLTAETRTGGGAGARTGKQKKHRKPCMSEADRIAADLMLVQKAQRAVRGQGASNRPSKGQSCLSCAGTSHGSGGSANTE